MLRVIVSLIIIVIVFSCAAETKKTSYNYIDGEGKFTKENFTLPDTIDTTMVYQGGILFAEMCTACHRVAKERLIGPGLKGVTKRRTPQWIMNFVTNPVPMIDKDTSLHSLVQLCIVEMPDLGLTDEQARDILEYLRNTDSKKDKKRDKKGGY